MRLDIYISNIEDEVSRNQAQSLIKDGLVKVAGKVITKPAFKILENPSIEILKNKIYVSRAGDKLNLFLENCLVDIQGKTVLDIGASTGGFTEVLLEKGAEKIIALDVGTLQLSEKLRKERKVISVENMDIRKFKSESKFKLITCDVSFISILAILDSIDSLASGEIVLLFKPQFEVGRDVKRDRNGVLLDQKAIEKSLINFIEITEKLNWKLIVSEKSKLKGKEGNKEIFLYFQKM